MERYEKYKASTISGLEEIPVHWNEIRMRYIGFLYGGLSGKSASDFNKLNDANNKTFIPFTNIASNVKVDSTSLQNVVVHDNEKQNEVKNGDLFFLMSSENYDDVGLSSVLCEDLEKTFLNSFCKGFRVTSSEVLPIFLNYQLRSKELRHNLLVGANGFTRINLKIDKVNDLKTALPPLSEQTAIANYLDRKTAEIDALIAKKKRLLELYEEEKTAIINHAVTKGINPDAPMKDSGIPWLGEVPEGWEVLSLKRCSSVQTGRTPKISGSDIDYFDNGTINWYTPGDFTSNKLPQVSKRRLDSCALENQQVDIFLPFSIYLVSIGATLGKVGISETSASANQQINVIQFDCNQIVPSFGYYFLSGNTEMIKTEADYTTLPILNQTKLKNVLICKPSLKEQNSIILYIEDRLELISTKVNRAQDLIKLLSEYRTALISEVVTGKVKVDNMNDNSDNLI